MGIPIIEAGQIRGDSLNLWHFWVIALLHSYLNPRSFLWLLVKYHAKLVEWDFKVILSMRMAMINNLEIMLTISWLLDTICIKVTRPSHKKCHKWCSSLIYGISRIQRMYVYTWQYMFVYMGEEMKRSWWTSECTCLIVRTARNWWVEDSPPLVMHTFLHLALTNQHSLLSRGFKPSKLVMPFKVFLTIHECIHVCKITLKFKVTSYM